jgi:predicted amidohydrolase YtcJ
MDAIRMYTINNAFILRMDEEIGSLEAGKQADFIVLDRDILTCPESEISDIQVMETYLEGRSVYRRDKS